eukprot:7266263-Pyramimonas_sp.AAC.1
MSSFLRSCSLFSLHSSKCRSWRYTIVTPDKAASHAALRNCHTQPRVRVRELFTRSSHPLGCDALGARRYTFVTPRWALRRAALRIRHTPMGIGARGVTHSSHPDGRWDARR